jgi:long-chain-fatty-acid--CoA ligase ACSBG
LIFYVRLKIYNIYLVTILGRSSVYFARPDALSGSLAETLTYVNPTVFFAVPRVYEKFEDKIRKSIDSGSFIKKKLGILK